MWTYVVFRWWMVVTECFSLWWLVANSDSVKNLSVEHCMYVCMYVCVCVCAFFRLFVFFLFLFLFVFCCCCCCFFYIYIFKSHVHVLLAAKITDAIPSSAWNSAGVPALTQIELYIHNRNVTTHQRKLYLYNLVRAFHFTPFIYILHKVTIWCRCNLCLHVLCPKLCTPCPCFMP